MTDQCFIAAVRHRDGKKNMYQVCEVSDHDEVRAHIKESFNPRVILVSIPCGKSLKRATIPQEEAQEQTA